MKINVKKVNAFTETINGGNPAGVVLNSPVLNCNQMKFISKTLHVSETAFVFPSSKADYKIRFFSPEHEVDLCGHATIATFFSIGKERNFKKAGIINITQETKAGILPVDIYYRSKNTIDKVMMTQNKAIYKDIYLDISNISDSLKITRDKIDNTLPKQIVSTGLYTLPINIDSIKTLKKIKPDYEKIKKICIKHGIGSYHLYTFDTIESNSIYHARNFAPLYGINEDPVTGTANGAICSYLLKNKIITKRKVICEQGDIIGRPGRVMVEIEKDIVKVGGKAKIVEEIQINQDLN